MTPRISPHTQSPHTTIDYLAALTNCRLSSGYLRIPSTAEPTPTWPSGLRTTASGQNATVPGAATVRSPPPSGPPTESPSTTAPARENREVPASRSNGSQHQLDGSRTSGRTPWNSGTARSPSLNPPPTPADAGSPHDSSGAQSCRCRQQSGGSTPSTSSCPIRPETTSPEPPAECCATSGNPAVKPPGPSRSPLPSCSVIQSRPSSPSSRWRNPRPEVHLTPRAFDTPKSKCRMRRGLWPRRHQQYTSSGERRREPYRTCPASSSGGRDTSHGARRPTPADN